MNIKLVVVSGLALVSTAAIAEDAETSRDTAPYARVFQQDQSWTFASSSTNERKTEAAHCHVEEVSTLCDRTVSQVVCDAGAAQQVFAGTYATNARGMWKVDDPAMAESHGPLPVEKRAFARFPESLVDANGKTLATPYKGGWCTTSTVKGATQTICIDAKHGFLGGSIAKADTKIVLGDVPRS